MVEESRVRDSGRPHPAVPLRLLVIPGAWGLAIGVIQLYAWCAMLTPSEVLQQLVVACRMDVTGPLLFIGMAALSPLLLVPAALLGGLAGSCFGPALGILYTLVGCNLSVLLTCSLGRLSRQEHSHLARLCAHYAALPEKRNAGAPTRGELTTVTMPGGLVEGAETVVLYTLFLLFPGALVPLFGLMAVLVLFTAAQRGAWAVRHLT